MRKLVLLLLFFTAVSCGSSHYVAPVVVHASTPPCSTERFYDGATETPDYLQFASQACLISENVLERYTLKYDHTVQAADLQMGSNTGSTLEWAFWVDFVTPQGRSFSLFMQYDKHQDVVGNRQQWRTFTAPLRLVAGTTITIRRPALPDAYCTAPGKWGDTTGCATGQKIELVGVIQ